MTPEIAKRESLTFCRHALDPPTHGLLVNCSAFKCRRWGKGRRVSTCLFSPHNGRLVLSTDGWRRLGRGGMGPGSWLVLRERGDRRIKATAKRRREAGAEDQVPARQAGGRWGRCGCLTGGKIQLDLPYHGHIAPLSAPLVSLSPSI